MGCISDRDEYLARVPVEDVSAASALLALLKADNAREFSLPLPIGEEAQSELADLAEHHKVIALLGSAVRGDERLHPNVAERLKARYRQSLERHIVALEDLRRLSELLESLKVPWAVFKGPVLAENAYPRPGLRAYIDLDVLVSPRDLRRVVEALRDSGAPVAPVSFEPLLTRRWAEFPVVLWHGTTLDLHWSLFARPQHRDAFHMRTERVLADARLVELAGISVRTFSDPDALLHLAIHAQLAGGERLGWWKDVTEFVRSRSMDWDVVGTRANTAQARSSVGVMLYRCARWLDAPVPESALQDLVGLSVWPRLIRSLDERFPPNAQRRVAGRIVVGATRASAARSAAEATRLLVVRRLFPKLSALPTDRSAKQDPPGTFERYLDMAEQSA